MVTTKVRRINVLPKYIIPQNSKCFKLIKIYLGVLHILFCLDLGLFDYKPQNQRIFWKSITVMRATAFFYFIHFSSHFAIPCDNPWSYFLRCYYYIYVLSLAFTSADKTLYSAFAKLKEIDIALRIDLSFLSEVKMIVTISLHLLFRLSILVAYWVIYRQCYTYLTDYNVLTTIAHSIIVFYSLIFHFINCRLKKVTSLLKKSSSGFSSLQITYKMIVDLSDAQKNSFDPLVSKTS